MTRLTCRVVCSSTACVSRSTRCWRCFAPAPTPLRIPSTVPLFFCARALATLGDANAPAEEEFVFDPTLSVQRDAAVSTAKKSLDGLLRDVLPPNAPAAAIEKARAYLQQHPMDTLIIQPKVQITHIEDPDSGVETKMSLSPCELSEALQHAKERSMNLVQMGARGDIAYCRIRHETTRILALVSAELEAAREEAKQEKMGGRGDGEHAKNKTRELVDHSFRDVVDAHYVGWKSKKIVEDIKKRHPVKLTIKQFQSPTAAISKMREMCQAMQRYAEENVVYHHFTSIVANDREVSVTFAPSLPSAKGNAWKHIKYPGEKEWTHAIQRMDEACRKSGRYGTYAKNNVLKPRSLGRTFFRVDKYGRKTE